MAFINITADMTYVGKQLRRIADALEAIAPPLVDAPDELKPEDAVTYADDETLATQEQHDLARELGQVMDELPEGVLEGYGEGDVR